MKGKIITIMQPVLLWVLDFVLQNLKPYFISENKELKKCLKKYGFHLALCNHPSILFGYSEILESKKIKCLNLKLKFISKCVRVKLLATPYGKEILKKNGIVMHYSRGVEFWFEEAHSPIVPYILPNYDKPKDKKVAVYTALTGNYDNVNEILYKEDGVDYFLFTNNPSINSNTWQVVLVTSELGNQLLSREIKMLPHKYLDKKYDMSVYIDANAVIYGELSLLLNYIHGNASFAVSKHGERTTVLQEVERVTEVFKHINRPEVLQQYESYINRGFVDNLGLAECTILVRKHKEIELQNLMNLWWKEFVNGVRRDQVSLMPCISAIRFDSYRWMDGYVRHNQFCKIVSHK